MTTNFSHVIVRTFVGIIGSALLATTFVGAAAGPAKAAATVQTSLSARTI